MGVDFGRIKIVCTDVDGSLTDGSMFVGNDGSLIKKFNTYDGIAVNMILSKGMYLFVVTNAHDDVIIHRMKQICGDHNHPGLCILRGICNKKDAVEKMFVATGNWVWEDVAFFGDATNDLEAMQASAWTGCPKNAWTEVKDESNFIADNNGGEGAFLEFVKDLFERKVDQDELF